MKTFFKELIQFISAVAFLLWECRDAEGRELLREAWNERKKSE